MASVGPLLDTTQPLPEVRSAVRDVLLRSQAFRELPKDKRDALANDMVRVANFVVAGQGNTIPSEVTLADVQPPDPRTPDMEPPGETAGKRFGPSGANAATSGTQALTDTITKVNFPKFVAGLIDGVFNAIVDASIKQMDAYSELLKNVVKSVEEYMKDNVSENSARDYLVGRYPDALEVDLNGETPKLKAKQGAEDGMPDFMADLGLKTPVADIGDEASEKSLVLAARRRIALDRQQLLATMVLMGVNRLVVTDGSISASVLFELNTTDSVTKHYNRASTYHDKNVTETTTKPSWWGWFGGSTTQNDDTTNFTVTTTRSEDSTAKAELHAKLAGKVDVRFRTDAFPLERMADVLQINKINAKAPAGAAPAASTQSAGILPAAAPPPGGAAR